MDLKSKLTLATLICTSMFATGCQQMQQTAGASQQTTGASQQTTSSQQTACECQPCEQAAKPVPPPAPVVKRPPPPRRAVVPPPVKVPQVKAKGAYKGAVQMDSATKDVMQQYQR